MVKNLIHGNLLLYTVTVYLFFEKLWKYARISVILFFVKRNLDTLKSYTCACPDDFTDTDSANPGRNCEEIPPCCYSIKVTRSYTWGLDIFGIFDAVIGENGDYFSYDAHTMGVS